MGSLVALSAGFAKRSVLSAFRTLSAGVRSLLLLDEVLDRAQRGVHRPGFPRVAAPVPHLSGLVGLDDFGHFLALVVLLDEGPEVDLADVEAVAYRVAQPAVPDLAGQEADQAVLFRGAALAAKPFVDHGCPLCSASELLVESASGTQAAD